MDNAFEDLLEAWAMHNCPALLCHDEAMTKLILFIHKLVKAAVENERASLHARLTNASVS